MSTLPILKNIKDRFTSLIRASTPDRVSEIAAETAVKQDKSLRGLQTRLHLAARWRHKMRKVEQLALAAQIQAYRTRPRCHFGDASQFENSVVAEFSAYDGWEYLRLQSGQVIHKSTAHRNPQLNAAVKEYSKPTA